MVGRQNADIADNPHPRDVATATTLWLLMGYNFGCIIATDTLFDSRRRFFGVKLSDVLRDVAMAAIFFGFLYMGCTLAPPGKDD